MLGTIRRYAWLIVALHAVMPICFLVPPSIAMPILRLWGVLFVITPFAAWIDANYVARETGVGIMTLLTVFSMWVAILSHYLIIRHLWLRHRAFANPVPLDAQVEGQKQVDREVDA